MAQDATKSKDWKELAAQASIESDPEKLLDIIERLNSALTQHLDENSELEPEAA
jgi:hypothetical protein